MPSAKRIAAESGVSTASVAGTGKDGRVTKGDMLGALQARPAAPAAAAPATPAAAPADTRRVPTESSGPVAAPGSGERRRERKSFTVGGSNGGSA